MSNPFSRGTQSDVVTIIVPTYNRSEYLRACLTSIKEQTYSYIAVIVVDDGSTEDIKSVINSINWPDSFVIQYIRLDENRGQGYAREVGRLRATGAYINYQDSDDLFHPDKITTQIAMLQNHPEAGMCYCIALDFSQYPFDGTEKLRGSHYIDKILSGVLVKRPWATGSCMWTRIATDAIGAWFNGRHGEDLLYDVRAGCKDISIVYIPQILMYVRRHMGESEMRVPSKKIYQQTIAAYHEMLHELEVAGKLKDMGCQIAITREVFRICRKLFDLQDTETAFSILQHLVSTGRSMSNIHRIYFLLAIFILWSRHIFPQKLQAHVFCRLCSYALIF